MAGIIWSSALARITSVTGWTEGIAPTAAAPHPDRDRDFRRVRTLTSTDVIDNAHDFMPAAVELENPPDRVRLTRAVARVLDNRNQRGAR
jgi:hypothetical protein